MGNGAHSSTSWATISYSSAVYGDSWQNLRMKSGQCATENTLTLSPVETCFHKAHMNLYGVFILGVNIKYGLSFCFFGQ